MPSRERPVDRARRVVDRDLVRVGEEIRSARIGAGLSLRFVGERAGLSASQVMRIERALVPNASYRQVARIGSVVGLDVRLRAYPGPDPIRDAPHAKVLGRLPPRLHVRLLLRHEVPLPITGDQRAWDGWISGFEDPRDGGLPVDAETRLHDVQALLRRLALKARDSGVDHVLLVVADTRSNRQAVAAATDLLRATFPVSGDVPSRPSLPGDIHAVRRWSSSDDVASGVTTGERAAGPARSSVMRSA
jgi:transcriptional regulator with XRE-family HTH domain